MEPLSGASHVDRRAEFCERECEEPVQAHRLSFHLSVRSFHSCRVVYHAACAMVNRYRAISLIIHTCEYEIGKRRFRMAPKPPSRYLLPNPGQTHLHWADPYFPRCRSALTGSTASSGQSTTNPRWRWWRRSSSRRVLRSDSVRRLKCATPASGGIVICLRAPGAPDGRLPQDFCEDMALAELVSRS